MAEPFSLPPLPYAESALAPTISAQTIGLHYGKHHKTYVDTLNKLVTGTELADQSLEDIIKTTAGNPIRRRSSTTPDRSGTTISIGVALDPRRVASLPARSRTS